MGRPKRRTAAARKMGTLSLEQALHEASLQDEPGRKAEDALEAFVKLLLREYPSLRSRIVEMVERRTWNEAPLEEARQPTDLPSALKAIEIHECGTHGRAATDPRATPAGKTAEPTAQMTAQPVSMALRCVVLTNATQSSRTGITTRDTRSAIAAANAETEPETEADIEPETETEPETELKTEPETEQEDESENLEMVAECGSASAEVVVDVGGARSSTQTTDPEGDPGSARLVAKMATGDTTGPPRHAEPPHPEETIVVAESAATDVRSSLEPLRTRDGSVAAEIVERDRIRDARRFSVNVDPESESESSISRDTTIHTHNSRKRQCEESLVPHPKKKIRFSGTYMASRYADLRYLCLLFANALRSRRRQDQHSEVVAPDSLSFQQKLTILNTLGSQRDLYKVQSTYLSAGLAKQWIETTEEYARQNATRRKYYLPDAEARQLLKLLTDDDLDAFRTTMRRWHVLENVRRFFEPDIGEQSIVAIFAFPDPTCE
jgi:hypothetical protein